jgi:hypothetical protein
LVLRIIICGEPLELARDGEDRANAGGQSTSR